MPSVGCLSLSLRDIAAQLGGDVLGDADIRISQVASLQSAAADQIAFLANPKYRAQLMSSAASAFILPPNLADVFDKPRIITPNPYAYYARVATLLNPPKLFTARIDSSAVISSSFDGVSGLHIEAHVAIGKNVTLGDDVTLLAGVVLGDNVKVGAGTVLHPGVVVYRDCQIGSRCILHAGAVIGADGFGFAPDQGKWVKIPQIGRVIIGDDVEIGAKTTVDRGALDDTVIGDGSKLDNQIQVGHNCVIGQNTVISGCTAIAGSTRIGSGCMIGGAAMITGHLSICDGAIISAGTFVAKNITKPGQYTSVFPVESHEKWLQNASQIRHLGKLAERVSQLEKQLKNLEIKD